MFAQMPNGSSSIVTARIRPTIPALAAQYGDWWESPMVPCTEANPTMRP